MGMRERRRLFKPFSLAGAPVIEAENEIDFRVTI
jgi:hypothetical protein